LRLALDSSNAREQGLLVENRVCHETSLLPSIYWGTVSG
jgi:hypothetical protein